MAALMACVKNSNKIDPEPEMRKSITLALFALFLLAGLGFVESRLVAVHIHPHADSSQFPELSQPWADDRWVPSTPPLRPVAPELWHLNSGDLLPEPRLQWDMANGLTNLWALKRLPALNLSRAVIRQSRHHGTARTWPRNGIDARQQAG